MYCTSFISVKFTKLMCVDVYTHIFGELVIKHLPTHYYIHIFLFSNGKLQMYCPFTSKYFRMHFLKKKKLKNNILRHNCSKPPNPVSKH